MEVGMLLKNTDLKDLCIALLSILIGICGWYASKIDARVDKADTKIEVLSSNLQSQTTALETAKLEAARTYLSKQEFQDFRSEMKNEIRYMRDDVKDGLNRLQYTLDNNKEMLDKK